MQRMVSTRQWGFNERKGGFWAINSIQQYNINTQYNTIRLV